jgi:glycosyltransferase involved in cell wall biosynthesis
MESARWSLRIIARPLHSFISALGIEGFVNSARQQTVSLCMIVRNEEKNLHDCLAPVASLFDDIVIIDTGSEDGTKEIAARFTDRVFDFEWCEDFAAARNESLKRSRGDWIFWLDADDRISPSNVAQLQAVIRSLGERPQAYYINTVVHGRYECEAPQWVSHPRLVRRHPMLQWRGRVHERFWPDLAQLGHELIWSDIRIDHVGYQDPVQQKRKLQRDIRLLRMDYAIDPDDCNTILQMAMAYAELGNHAEARKLLFRLLEANHTDGQAMSLVYRLLADISPHDGDLEGSLRILDLGLSKFPGHQSLLYSRALLLFQLGRFEEARAPLQQIMSSPQSHQHYVVPGEIKQKLAPRKLADIYRMQQNYDAAEQVLQSLVQENPHDTHSWYALGSVYLDCDQDERLNAVVGALEECPQGKLFAAVLLTWRHMKRREIEPAGILIDGLVSEIPEVPLPRLLRCQWLELKGAPPEHRLQACRDLLRVEPHNQQGLAALPLLEHAVRLASTPAQPSWSSSVVVGAGMDSEIGMA